MKRVAGCQILNRAMEEKNSSGSMKCLKREKAMEVMDMDEQLPQLVQTPHTVTSCKHLTVTTPFSVVRENGCLFEREAAVVCDTRSGQQMSLEAQSKKDRRRMQKRKSAQKKRRKEKQIVLDLQSNNKKLRMERDNIKSQILKLEANAGYARSMLSTIREMKIMTSNQRPHPPSPPAPPQPPAGQSLDVVQAATTAAMSSATTMSGPVIPVSSQSLAQGRILETADQRLLWTGQHSVGSVSKFSTGKEVWNPIPSDADPRGPVSIRTQQLFSKVEPMLSSQASVSVFTGDMLGDPGMDQFQTITDLFTSDPVTSTMSEVTSFIPVTAMSGHGVYTTPSSSLAVEDDHDLIDFLRNFANSPHKINLTENTASAMWKDELRCPLPSPTKDSTGSPEPLSGPWHASTYIDLQDVQIVELKAEDAVCNISSHSENWVLPAQNYT